jgi:cytoskeletal protein RodZ
MAEEHQREVIDFPQPRLTAGARLRAARERSGLSLEQVAGETRIPMRMLTLIEAGNFAALPAKAYAMGFTRTYARALGLDADELVGEVRRELGMVEQHDGHGAPAFEPGDPARVPTARFAWLAAVAALVVLAAGLVMWRSYYAPSMTLPPLPEATAPAEALAPAPVLEPLASGVPAVEATVGTGTVLPPPVANAGPTAGVRTPGAAATTRAAPAAARTASPAPAATSAPQGAGESPAAVSGGPVAGARASASPAAAAPSTTQ